jgi:hypothetical protein
MEADDSVEASELGWKPGECAASICRDGEDYLFRSVEKRRGEVTGWIFATIGGKTLMVWND